MMKLSDTKILVAPAQAGAQFDARGMYWIPAFAGMTMISVQYMVTGY